MIRLENINKTYYNGSPLHVLKGIDLEIGEGEMVSIMGASGSGKSTLLNILGILDDYDSGEYFLDGKPIKNLSETKAAEYRNRMIGFIFQSFNLISYKNAMENVALPLYYQGVPRRKRNAMALEFLDRLGLRDWHNGILPVFRFVPRLRTCEFADRESSRFGITLLSSFMLLPETRRRFGNVPSASE